VVLAHARAEHDPLRFMPPERALVERCGTFPIKLYEDGRLVVSGSCFVHAFQYRDYYFIEYRLNRTWMLLRRGRWIIEDLFRSEDGAGSGGLPRQDRQVLHAGGRITAVSAHLGGQGGNQHVPPNGPLRIPARIACGVSADHPAPPPNFRVQIVTTYTIISWPTFKVVATGVRELPW
jgi:hypothetical protein